ncbi:MAG: FG-GAP-like repeat-containing protein [Acidobacteriota bacterium]
MINRSFILSSMLVPWTLIAPASAAAAAAVTFASPQVLNTTGLHPTALALGDFNGTGRRDIAVSFSNGTQTLLDNRTIGTPGPRVSSRESSPLRVEGGGGVAVLGDFDRDNIDDWTFSNFALKQIVIFGGGASPLSLSRTMPRSPLGIQLADVDADGNLDAVIGYDANVASLMRGTGNGSLAPAVDIAVGGGPLLVVSDVNGDGALDIAAVATQGPRVFAATGSGAGTFAPPNVIADLPESASSFVEGLAARAIRASELPTLAISVRDNAANRSRLYVLRGGDSGAQATALRESAGHLHATFADIDRDGAGDLVVADSASNRVSVFRGNPDGTWPLVTTVELQSVTMTAMVAGDVSGDGVADVIVASDDGKVTVYVNTTTSSPSSRRRAARH